MLDRDSFILRKTATIITLLVQVFAIYLFFRGHNHPGGGFIAGVASGIGILLLVLANGSHTVTRICPFEPLRLCGWGLAIATLSGLLGLSYSGAFLTHYHYKNPDFPALGSLYLGTPLLFDLGVFMVVLGVIAKVSFVLFDALQQQEHLEENPYRIPTGSLDHGIELAESQEKEVRE